jgi:hypothetical protein
VKKFSKVLLIITFALFVAGSAQSISADHLESNGKGIFTDQNDVNLVSDKGSKFQLHIQVVVRDAQGQLVSVLETSGGEYLRHELTDGIFEYRMGEKEIITIDNIKYEKVQYTYTPTLEHRFMGLYPIFSENYALEFKSTPEAREQMHKHKDFAQWKIHYCATFEGHGFSCLPIFQDLVPTMTLEKHDVITHQWTILRILN